MFSRGSDTYLWYCFRDYSFLRTSIYPFACLCFSFREHFLKTCPEVCQYLWQSSKIIDNDVDNDDSGVDGVAAGSVGVTTDDTDGVSEGEEMVGSDEIVGVAGSGSGTVSRTRLLRKPDFSTISDWTSTAIYFSNHS